MAQEDNTKEELSGEIKRLYERIAALEILIGECKQAEAENARLLAIIEESPGFIGTADMQGNLQYHNRAAKRMVGLPEDADLGSMKISDMHPSAAAKLVEEEGFPAIISRGSWRSENVLLHRNGSEIPVSQVLVLHRNPSGEPEFVSTIMRDITERKKIDEALQKSEKLYRSLFENMLNGFAYCQMHFDENDRPLDFTYLSVNRAFESLTGLRNVIGKKASEVIPGIRESDPRLFEIYGRVSKTGKPECIEIFVNSLQMWFWVSAYSLERGYFVAVFDVITERKRIEEEARKHLHELEVFYKAAIGREDRIVELKEEVEKLKKETKR